jgi:hypothetical protein
MITNILETLSRLLTMPRTKIIYDSLGVPEPAAWKYIIVGCFPTGILLAVSVFFDHPFIKFLTSYPDIFALSVGTVFALGSTLVMSGWWYPNLTQSKRVLLEIKGEIFLAASFLTVALCGLPTIGNNTFTFVISLCAALGSLDRAVQLIRNHFKLLKVKI